MNTDLPKPPVLAPDMSVELQLAAIGDWIQNTHRKLQQIVDELARNSPRAGQPVELPEVSLASLPKFRVTAGTRLVCVTDEVGGKVPAFSDGADWRRVTDRDVVS